MTSIPTTVLYVALGPQVLYCIMTTRGTWCATDIPLRLCSVMRYTICVDKDWTKEELCTVASVHVCMFIMKFDWVLTALRKQNVQHLYDHASTNTINTIMVYYKVLQSLVTVLAENWLFSYDLSAILLIHWSVYCNKPSSNKTMVALISLSNVPRPLQCCISTQKSVYLL